MIQPERIQCLNRAPQRRGRYVLYWMQQAQRVEFNHALECAVREANARNLPVLVCFGITPTFPEARHTHYRFLLEGLRETAAALHDRGIGFLARPGAPDTVAIELAANAALLVTDRGYLRLQKTWRDRVAAAAACPVIQVETDVVVPVEQASAKEEYSAATLRRRITPLLDRYLVPVTSTRPARNDGPRFSRDGLDLRDIDAVLLQLGVPITPQHAGAAGVLRGGADAANGHLTRFLHERLPAYADLRNDPARDLGSAMSAYLHFGQISPLDIALRVQAAATARQAARDAYIEELIVRRELAMNFVHYNPAYDTYGALPDWARQTLAPHTADPRPYVYAHDQLEQAATHDPYWNAAQLEMILTGRMHTYMRMYWGKKIVEWSETPEQAFATALSLNNTYELDGRDPNGFAGIAWCFGKHDRAWPERPVFGKVRYMNANGLRRKFDMIGYLERVRACARHCGHPAKGLG